MRCLFGVRLLWRRRVERLGVSPEVPEGSWLGKQQEETTGYNLRWTLERPESSWRGHGDHGTVLCLLACMRWLQSASVSSWG